MIKLFSFGASRLPARAQGFEAGANAHAFSHHLPRNRRSVIVEVVQDAKLERIDCESKGKIVVELLLRDCRLRHTEAAKGARGNNVRMDGPRECAIVWDHIRSGGMHWNPSRNGRAPRGISAGIEIGGEVERQKFPLLAGPGTATHQCRMPLSGAHH